MQLKRDIDYSLRILLYVVKQEEYNKKAIGMTVSELSKNATIPSTIVSRLSRKMNDMKLLKAAKTPEGNMRYTSYGNTAERTLLDVICAIEGHSSLFSVFDKSTAFYSCCKDCFEGIDQQFTDSLNSITIKHLSDAMQTEEATFLII